ncbi:MAG: HEPN domain-containing protein [Saprospiraceae bacterium]|jgi:uncharacterized protein (UPF0332 family)|nr:HEPN domain-containing protein [Saprospiraceae bacterium]
MITPEKRRQLIANQILRAEKAIAQADFCLVNNQFDLAFNRIYYGMFYAMQALALLHGFETSKHQQLIGWFNKNFVHAGIFPNDFTAYIKKAFDARTDADYDMEGIDFESDVEPYIADMKLFISTIKDYLETRMQAE